MKCEARFGPIENFGKWPCEVCRKGVDSNSIKCIQWIHRCRGGYDKLQNVAGFRCKRYVDTQLFQEDVTVKEISISSLDKLECVDRFCYLGDLIGGAGGGAELASRARVRCAGAKFRELAPELQSLHPECRGICE